jgi:hypothetical protein
MLPLGLAVNRRIPREFFDRTRREATGLSIVHLEATFLSAPATFGLARAAILEQIPAIVAAPPGPGVALFLLFDFGAPDPCVVARLKRRNRS